MEDRTIRVNIRISQKLKAYFENRSLETGVAQSALMALALEEYICQKQVIEFTTGSQMKEMMAKLSEVEKNEKNYV